MDANASSCISIVFIKYDFIKIPLYFFKIFTDSTDVWGTVTDDLAHPISGSR